MSNIKLCFGVHRPANDELYTPESTAEYILDKYDYVLNPRLMVKKRSDDRVKTFKEAI